MKTWLRKRRSALRPAGVLVAVIAVTASTLLMAAPVGAVEPTVEDQTTSTTTPPPEESSPPEQPSQPPGDSLGSMSDGDVTALAVSVNLSKSTGLDPDGEQITISASGFTFGEGYYAMFCKSTGNPPGDAAGRPTGAACNSSVQYWTNQPGGTPVAADGTFSTTMSPVATYGTVDCFTDNCGVFVRRDHLGTTDYTKDVFVPVTFAVPGPTVQLSKSTGLDPDGEQITISASGFTFGEGYYAMFCKSTGNPPGDAAGRPTGAACNSSVQYWTNQPGGTPVAADGTFSTTMSPVATYGTVDCFTDNCGVFVRRDHLGTTDYTKDVFVPVTFAVPGPTVQLSKSTGLDPDGEQITISASGFTFGEGYYAMFCKSTGNPPGDAAGRPTGAACNSSVQYWTNQPGGTPVAADGTFSTTMSPVATYGTVDCFTDNCGVFVRRDHLGTTDYTKDVFVPVTFAVPGPTVQLSKSTGLDPDGEQITVTGSHFDPTIGVYVRVCKQAAGELGTSGGRPAGADCDAPKDIWLTDVEDDGTFTTPISPQATFNAVDCSVVTCGIFVRRDHNGGTSDFSQDAFTAITFGEEDPGGGPGDEDPTTPGGMVTGDLVPGGSATATLWGFAPFSSAEGWLHSTPVSLGSYQANGAGTVTIPFVIPLDFSGAHELEAIGIDPEAGNLSVRVPFMITSIDTLGIGAGSLPLTGSGIADLAAAGIVTVLIGAVVVLNSRRRRPAL